MVGNNFQRHSACKSLFQEPLARVGVLPREDFVCSTSRKEAFLGSGGPFEVSSENPSEDLSRSILHFSDRIFKLGLSSRLSRDRRQDLYDRKRWCLKTCSAILWLFCLISGHRIMVWKGPRSPKHSAMIAVLRSYLSPLFLLLGRDPCGDRILRSCLQKHPATALANYELGVPSKNRLVKANHGSEQLSVNSEWRWLWMHSPVNLETLEHKTECECIILTTHMTENREGQRLSGRILCDAAILLLRCPISPDTSLGRLAPPHNGAIMNVGKWVWASKSG